MHTYLRCSLIAGAISLFSTAANAQDVIHLDDGTSIEAKVKEIGPKNITYRRWDNQEGADYILNRNDVTRIVYDNGTEESFSTRRGGRPSPFDRPRMEREDRRVGMRGRSMDPGYGRNIISVAPLQMTNESPVGFGVQYERILDRSGIFSLYLPVAISLYDDEGPGVFPGGSTRATTRTFTYVYPGVKFYPAGSGRRASYSVGPSIALGFGEKYREEYIGGPGGGFYRWEEANVFKAGFMINNGLNIQPTKALYVGLEFGLGIQYYNNEFNDTYVVGDEPMVQFNFKMGYRF